MGPERRLGAGVSFASRGEKAEASPDVNPRDEFGIGHGPLRTGVALIPQSRIEFESDENAMSGIGLGS